ncbi:MAG TPA: A/G-specific adenine glycosylase [Flavipsychrobacter sp.]
MEMQKAQQQYFTRQLMDWHHNDNDRNLPWKSEKDPYKIWLSEIILQQTRAQQGLPYYLRFTETYPTIIHLANSSDEAAFRIWQGLGYYNRCKNMLATARYVAQELDGKFPDTYENIIALKGIGPYTAAAIASFAYNLPRAVVDGNVYRVLARYFGIDTPFDSTEGKKQFAALAQQLLDVYNSAAYNQAIMDLGATVCTPQNPLCDACPLQKKCVAYKQDMIQLLPVRSKKQAVRKRYFHYLLLTHKNKLWLRKRTGKDIWQNLYEPLLVEADETLTAEKLVKIPAFKALGVADVPAFSDTLNQKLTHQHITFSFFTLPVKSMDIDTPNGGVWVDSSDLKNYAFPKSVLSFLEKIFYF